MQTSQRGSVLLTIIGGIIILALLGMVAVSLMTGSVMTGLDVKETVQASYLAESGKEIVRVQTSKADTGARLMTLVDDTLDGKTFSITGGNVSLKLFPSWFRTSDTGTLLKGGSGWYPEAPSGTRELLLIAKSGTASRAEYSFGKAAALTPNADAYLIGRGTPTYPTKTQTTISVNTAKNDFDYFPETGGLIGVVNKGGATLNPDSAKRLIYERLSKSGSTYTFEGVRPVSGSSYPELGEDKELVLGQYIRVVSEAQTANGARAALVWHTNGRSSLRFAGSGGSEEGGNATENIIGGNLSSEEDLKELFGQHLTEHNLNKGYTFTKYGPDLTALSVQGFQPSMPNHFLLKTTRKTSTDYWFAGITDKTIPIDSFQKERGVMIQISTMIHPPGSSKKPHFFGGLLFRTHMLQGKSALTPHGVSGLGMGIVYGSIEIENSEKEGYYEVDDCTINPALLPGFEWVSKDSNDPEEPDGSFRIAKTDWEQYSRIFVQGVPSAGRKMTIKPTLILWAYDDEELNDGNVSEPPDSLRCLAAASLGPNDVYSPLSTPLDAFYFTRIVTQVREHEGDNKIRAWIASQRPPKYGVTDYTKYDPETNNFLNSYDIAHTLELGKILDDIRNGFKVSEGALWPVLDFSDGVEQNLMTDRFTLIGWDYVNPEFSRFETEKVDGRSNIKTTILTQFATGAAYNRAGIFQGAYTEDDDKNNIPSTYNLNFRNFAVGIPGTGGSGTDDVPGLTPGIVQ